MAQTYDSAADRKVLLDAEPLHLRTFVLILIDANLLATKRLDFDRAHDNVSDIVGGDDFAENAERVALRTQLIKRPMDPVASSMPKILQFFAQDPNRNSLVERRLMGLIVENVGEGDSVDEVPLFLLNQDEVWSIAHGDGFATEVTDEDALVGAATARKRTKKEK
jgi:hypothetical protein